MYVVSVDAAFIFKTSSVNVAESSFLVISNKIIFATSLICCRFIVNTYRNGKR